MLFSPLKNLLSVITILLMLPVLVLGNHNSDETHPEDPARHNHTEHAINIDISLGDYWFKPDTLKVQAGHKIVLHLKNEGTIEHEFMAGKKVSEDMDHFKTGLFKDVPIERSKKRVSEDYEEDHGKMISLKRGESSTISFTLPESKTGTWEIGCFEKTAGNSHYKFGMKGILVVKPK
jgi:uncharacterized cupredoxin-like copper-binding protein